MNPLTSKLISQNFISDAYAQYNNQFLRNTGGYYKNLFNTGVLADTFDITNPNPTYVNFSQVNGCAQVQSYGLGTSSIFANIALSKQTFTTGGVIFSMNDFNSVDGFMCGLWIDANNRITLYQGGFYIHTGGTARYSLAGVNRSDKFQITISAGNVIRLHRWNGSAWADLGIDKTYDIGANKKFFMCAAGTTTGMGRLTVSELIFSNTPFTTLYS